MSTAGNDWNPALAELNTGICFIINVGPNVTDALYTRLRVLCAVFPCCLSASHSAIFSPWLLAMRPDRCKAALFLGTCRRLVKGRWVWNQEKGNVQIHRICPISSWIWCHAVGAYLMDAHAGSWTFSMRMRRAGSTIWWVAEIGRTPPPTKGHCFGHVYFLNEGRFTAGA